MFAVFVNPPVADNNSSVSLKQIALIDGACTVLGLLMIFVKTLHFMAGLISINLKIQRQLDWSGF